MEKNKQNIEAMPATYKKRQAIVEHPYGTIKSQWGFYYISTKRGSNHASADVGLMFVAYNLRRLMNIIDKNVFKKFLADLVALFLPKTTVLKVFKAEIKHRVLDLIFASHFYNPAVNCLKYFYNSVYLNS